MIKVNANILMGFITSISVVLLQYTFHFLKYKSNYHYLLFGFKI